ncbi:MAG TPA: TetR/AcrR family transcriptional regulator [Solirubrobacterales bacterium]|nr:TetR/AcrR family transcriptional regulator [Solirubrobacterales bacterium]
MAGANPQRQPESDPDQSDESRERLIAAASKAAAEHGYREVTVERIVRYAGVPATAFHAYFTSPEQAMLAAFDDFLEGIWTEVEEACEVHRQWPQKVKAAIGGVLAALMEASGLARAFMVEAGTASLAATERMLSVVDDFATVLRRGREIYPSAAALPEPTERALVGGVASIVSAHLLAENARALAELESQLVEILLTPYIGADEARRVAS